MKSHIKESAVPIHAHYWGMPPNDSLIKSLREDLFKLLGQKFMVGRYRHVIPQKHIVLPYGTIQHHFSSIVLFQLPLRENHPLDIEILKSQSL